jgi:hypothetical protein
MSTMISRVLTASCLLLVSLASAIAFGGYVEVKDTISFHWSAAAFDRLLFWIAYGGLFLLFACQMLRVFAARLMLGATLAACIAFTLHSLAGYPANHDDAHAAPVLSHTPMELYWLLLINGVLLLAVWLWPQLGNGMHKK